jgi:hypothetical protein
MSVVLAGEDGGIVLLTEPFSGGGGGVSSVTGSGNIASSGGATPNITFTGTLPVANGGTGVTASSGASSVVLRDANGNITTNATFNGFTSVAASGTPITLTAASTPVYSVTGSGGQVIQLPNATTLPNGTIFSFNNNQSSGAITVNNASSTLVVSIPSGGYVTVTLLSNAISAGSWDRHDQTPSNTSWSTNTLDYPGSITSATWNGVAVAANRGGTGVANNSASTITISGAFGTTFTVSGTTALTLPTTGTLSTLAGIETLTNKRITPRVSSAANITSPLAWNSDNFDQYASTAQSEALTISADAGTPTDGQKMIFRFEDNGTARALTWTTGSSKSFRAVGITLPTTTVASKTLYVGCVYNSADSRWDAIATAQEA